MARYPQYETAEGIARRWKEGRGIGRKADYKPWFTRFDMPSRGERRESFFRICDRGVHFLSKLEYHKGLVAKETVGLNDLWEQFPLPLAETQQIAAQLKITHPRSPRTKENVVMTTDLVLIVSSGSAEKRIAWATKYPDELRFWRSLEKLEIARVWHKMHGDEWIIQSADSGEETLISNLDWLHPLERRDAMLGYPEDVSKRVAETMHPWIDQRSEVLWRLAERCDATLGFCRPVSLYVCRFLLATKFWRTDLTKWRRKEEPLKLRHD